MGYDSKVTVAVVDDNIVECLATFELCKIGADAFYNRITSTPNKIFDHAFSDLNNHKPVHIIRDELMPSFYKDLYNAKHCCGAEYDKSVIGDKLDYTIITLKDCYGDEVRYGYIDNVINYLESRQPCNYWRETYLLKSLKAIREEFVSGREDPEEVAKSLVVFHYGH